MSRKIPVIHRVEIQPDWLDYNNHLNVAWYTHIFDLAGEVLAERMGFGSSSAETRQISWVVAESHIVYLKEILAGQTVEIGLQILDHDTKRIHLYGEIHVAGTAPYLAATQEQMILCVDLAKRKSAPFPQDALDRIREFKKELDDCPPPTIIGRVIGIPVKSGT